MIITNFAVVAISIFTMPDSIYHLLAVHFSHLPATWVKTWDRFLYETGNQFGVALVGSR